MSDYTTDVAEEATDVVEETVDPAGDFEEVHADETTETTDTQKVAGQIDPYGKRDGLSRSEKRRMKVLDEAGKLDRVYQFVEKQESQILEQERQTVFQSKTADLSDDSRKVAQDLFNQEYTELVDLGVSHEKALEKSLKFSITEAEKASENQEAKTREEARKGATLPPTNGAVPAKTVYLNSEICKMSPQEGADMRNKAARGEISITMDF